MREDALASRSLRKRRLRTRARATPPAPRIAIGLGGSGRRTVIIPCFRWRETSQAFTGYATANPAVSDMDIVNQKTGCDG